jgi:hypothetical protein
VVVGEDRSAQFSGKAPGQAAITLPRRRKRLGVYFQLYDHNIESSEMVAFVAHLLRMVHRRIMLVLDR